MTTEANDNDPRVSGAYHEMASEKTSAELDRKILSMAATEGGAAGGVPRAWLRPLAWAATVALSFALVLEISQVDDAPTPRADADLLEILEESPRADEAEGKQKDEARVRQQLNKRSSDAPASMKVTITPALPPAPAVGAPVNTPAMESSSVAADLEVDDMSLLREAEEQARMRTEPARSVASVAAFAEKKEQPDDCDSDARASAQTWYQCVKDLRDAGQTEPAKRELEALLAEFPDFREPAGDL